MISMINCWIRIIDMNQYIYSELTSELIAPHLIDVMSWVLIYEYICLIMIMNLWYVSQNTHANRVVLVFVHIVSEP